MKTDWKKWSLIVTAVVTILILVYMVTGRITGIAGGGNNDDGKHTESVQISLSTNQDISVIGAVITVQYADVSDEYTWNGNVIKIKIPIRHHVEISVNDFGNLKSPEAVSFVAESENIRNINLELKGEKVTILVSSETELDVSNIPVSILNEESGNSIATDLLTGESIIIPFGTTYKVVGSKAADHETSPISRIASEDNYIANVIYTELKTDFIFIDQNITDPNLMISGNINGSVIRWIRENTHRYLAKNKSNGEMYICQLDDNNSNLYFDGSAANLTGSEGQVFVRLPKFYYKVEETQPNIMKIGFSVKAMDSSWVQWDGKDLIGAYKAILESSKLKSVSSPSMSATVNYSKSTFSYYALQNGIGYSLVKWKHHNIIALLFFAKYGTTHSTETLGVGRSRNINIGISNSLGMQDSNSQTSFVNCFGLEDWWGNSEEYFENIVCNPESGKYLYRVTEDDNTTRDIPRIYGGHILKIVGGKYFDCIPKQGGSTQNLGFCSYGIDGGNLRSAVVRAFSSGAQGTQGIISIYSWYDENKSQSNSSRLAFRGELFEIKNVSEFKSK